MPSLPSGTVTLLFTDVEGSTRRWEEQPDAMRRAIGIHDDILREAIEAHGGYVFKTIGDAFCAAFSSAPQGLNAAVDAQRALYARDWGDVPPITVRMAVHTGAAEEREGNYFGPAVDRAMRLVGVGYGGQTLLSAAAAQLLEDSLPEGVTLVDLGERRLRDLTNREHIFEAVISGLPGDFPPLKTLEGRPNNLPVRTTALVGRLTEVSECRRMLRQADIRLLTLTGPGGIGKTRLGLHVCALLLDEFPDGVFFVSLATTTDPDMVSLLIAEALGVTESGGQSLVQRLKDFLRSKHLLLMLDNFEGLLPASPLVWELLAAAPRLKIIATSRSLLNLSVENEYQVPPLNLPTPGKAADPEELRTYEAVALFIVRAQTVKNDFRLTQENAQAVADICALLDGIPLAIELAAPRIRILSPQAMLSRLAGAQSAARLQMLTGGGRDLPARQQTMYSTLQWSYDLLAPEERVLFRRLSVFVRSSSFEAAEWVVSGPFDEDEQEDTAGPPATAPEPLDLDVLDGLSSLVDKSFLRQSRPDEGDVRFRMLELVREYGQQKLEESGESEYFHRRHALFFLRLAEEAEPMLFGATQGEWLARLEAEHDNLRAALEWANNNGDAGTGLRLAGALWRFWYVRNYFTEARNWLLGLLALPGAAAHPKARAKALNAAANILYNMGDYATSQTLHAESLAISRETGDRRAIAGSLNNLALILRNHGDHTQALAYLEEALGINREMNNTAWQAINLNNLATIHHQHGDWARARARQEESLALFTALGDKWGMAMSLADLGKVRSDQADYEEARNLYAQALQMQRELGDRRNVADILMSMGVIAWKQGDYAEAGRIFGEALIEFKDMGDRKGIASVLNYQGNLALYSGDYPTARSKYEASFEIRKDLGDKRDLAATYNNLGLVALEEGDLARAEEALRQAVELWREVGDRERISTSLNNLGRATLYAGDAEGASQLFTESLQLARDIDDAWTTAFSLYNAALLDIALGHDEAAREKLGETIRLREAVADKRGIAQSLVLLARLVEADAPARAVTLLAAARASLDRHGAQLDAADLKRAQASMADLKSRLGEQSYGEAWKAGSEMSIGDAAAFAVQDTAGAD